MDSITTIGPACIDVYARTRCAPMPPSGCDWGGPLCGNWQDFYDGFSLMTIGGNPEAQVFDHWGVICGGPGGGCNEIPIYITVGSYPGIGLGSSGGGAGSGNSSGGSSVVSFLRKIGNYIPMVCGAGGFAYGGARVSGGVASVGLYRIEAFDTRTGHSGGPFTDITIGEGIQGGYGYATYSGGESEHFLFGGVGGDAGIASAGVSLYGSHVSGDSILHNQIGINGDLGIPLVGAGVGLGVNTDSLTSCYDHHLH